MKVLEHPLDRLSKLARPYPAHLLPDGGTGLALFAAAYLGHNDVIHMARKEMVATCVDIDRGRLSEMESLYPDDWTFVHADAWEFAEEAAARGSSWDAVSVDTFTGDAEKRSVASLGLWCSLADHLVTVTVTATTSAAAVVPAGWRHVLYPRSDLASWLVLTRA